MYQVNFVFRNGMEEPVCQKINVPAIPRTGDYLNRGIQLFVVGMIVWDLLNDGTVEIHVNCDQIV